MRNAGVFSHKERRGLGMVPGSLEVREVRVGAWGAEADHLRGAFGEQEDAEGNRADGGGCAHLRR